MRRRKLLIGLLSAGAFTAGFGAAVFPASAQLRTITVTLLGGETVTVQVDVPPDTPADQVPLPGVTTPVAGVEEAPAPQQNAPAPQAPAGKPTSTAPSAPSGGSGGGGDSQPAKSADPGAPSVTQGGQQEQEITGRTIRKAADEADKAKKGADDEAAKHDADGNTIRQGDGVPTPANPTFSEALPGPAPIGVPNFFIDKFRIPPFLLPIYQAAGIEYGVRWEVLAGINEIETDYGRNLNVSSAGALGWMQFMPSTWKQYGVDANKDGRKDPYNPVDAIFAAARYLKAAGADTDVRRAIFAYNHAD